ncbi:MAG: chemotaxis protein CheW [Methylibium sp.]|uniref:chemotaxis protein CheW n=1 Tax=Methylibium sp. TaxID=2067992 RepID=UPI0017E68106|nr:chemotaxis protein CheW [Methylibium sp.]MBA3597342.1 chemotaxis protein CheW [Methylibium sp.]
MNTIQDATPVARADASSPARAEARPETRRKAAGAAAKPGREYLSFRLGGEEYGIDILKVQEIRSYEPPTRIANAPDFVRGVINLRGVIVPVIDLRVKFGCEATITPITAVIVLAVRGRVIGAVVDSVSDVLQLPEDSIKPVPAICGVVDTSYLMGIASIAERMLILVDIELLMTSDELGVIEAVV